MSDPSSDSEAESEDEDEEDAMEESTGEAQEDGGWLSDKIEAPPIKKPRLEPAEGTNPPPPCVYYPLTGVPPPGLLYVSLTAPTDPAPSLPVMEPPSKSKGKEKATEPSSPVSPSPHGRAARNKRSLPRSSKGHCKANRSPTPSGSKVDETAAVASDEVDNMIYVWAFHLQINLQFHEPPSRQALEYMKLSMLPSVPDSLTK